MRRRARVDANHNEIVNVLRQVGATVVSLAPMGNGVPDLMVGWRGQTYLLEVKDGSRPPSERRLTPDEEEFHAAWRGHVAIVSSIDEALEVIL